MFYIKGLRGLFVGILMTNFCMSSDLYDQMDRFLNTDLYGLQQIFNNLQASVVVDDTGKKLSFHKGRAYVHKKSLQLLEQVKSEDLMKGAGRFEKGMIMRAILDIYESSSRCNRTIQEEIAERQEYKKLDESLLEYIRGENCSLQSQTYLVSCMTALCYFINNENCKNVYNMMSNCTTYNSMLFGETKKLMEMIKKTEKPDGKQEAFFVQKTAIKLMKRLGVINRTW